MVKLPLMCLVVSEKGCSKNQKNLPLLVRYCTTAKAAMASVERAIHRNSRSTSSTRRIRCTAITNSSAKALSRTSTVRVAAGVNDAVAHTPRLAEASASGLHKGNVSYTCGESAFNNDGGTGTS